MQQTETYKLNLIETSDVFSPEPLNQNTRAVEAQLSAVRGEFAAADAGLSTQIATETAAREAEIARVDTTLAGRLRFKYDSYIGDGTHGTDNPNRLEFDFKPLMLLVSSPGSYTYGGRPWLRGISRGRTVELPSGAVHTVSLTWEDRAVEWVNSSDSDSAGHRMNVNNTVYYYLALGSAE